MKILNYHIKSPFPGKFDEDKFVLSFAMDQDGAPPLKRDRCGYQVSPVMVQKARDAPAYHFLVAAEAISKLLAEKEGDEARAVELIKQFGISFLYL